MPSSNAVNNILIRLETGGRLNRHPFFFLQSQAGNLIHSFAQFIAGFIIAFTTLWKLTLLTLGVMPIIVFNGGICAYIMVSLSNKSKQEYLRAGDIAHEVPVKLEAKTLFIRYVY